jgi:hypothetical protein
MSGEFRRLVVVHIWDLFQINLRNLSRAVTLNLFVPESPGVMSLQLRTTKLLVYNPSHTQSIIYISKKLKTVLDETLIPPRSLRHVTTHYMEFNGTSRPDNSRIKERERERNGAPKSNVLTFESLMANPKSGPDCSVFLTIFFFQFYMPRKMFSRTPGWRPMVWRDQIDNIRVEQRAFNLKSSKSSYRIAEPRSKLIQSMIRMSKLN